MSAHSFLANCVANNMYVGIIVYRTLHLNYVMMILHTWHDVSSTDLTTLEGN